MKRLRFPERRARKGDEAANRTKFFMKPCSFAGSDVLKWCFMARCGDAAGIPATSERERGKRN